MSHSLETSEGQRHPEQSIYCRALYIISLAASFQELRLTTRLVLRRLGVLASHPAINYAWSFFLTEPTSREGPDGTKGLSRVIPWPILEDQSTARQVTGCLKRHLLYANVRQICIVGSYLAPLLFLA